MERSSLRALSAGRWVWVGFFVLLALRALDGAEGLSDRLQAASFGCVALFALAFDPLKREEPTWDSLSWPRRLAAFLGVAAAALLLAAIFVR